MKNALIVCLFIFCQNACSSSLGVVGSVFPVEEESLLTLIESRINQLNETGALSKIHQQWILDVSRHANRPKALNLKRCEVHYKHRYVPQVVLNQDILDAKGRVLFSRGTEVNALDSLPTYQPHWIFFNADDRAQIKWVARALNKNPDAKIILTGGAVGEMESYFHKAIYFDQGGRISNQLGIKYVPAFVSRDQAALLIQEIAIREDGYAR